MVDRRQIEPPSTKLFFAIANRGLPHQYTMYLGIYEKRLVSAFRCATPEASPTVGLMALERREDSKSRGVQGSGAGMLERKV